MRLSSIDRVLGRISSNISLRLMTISISLSLYSLFHDSLEVCGNILATFVHIRTNSSLVVCMVL
jgi:hypothetical protein